LRSPRYVLTEENFALVLWAELQALLALVWGRVTRVPKSEVFPRYLVALVIIILLLLHTHERVGYPASLHVWRLLYARTKVFLFNREHLLHWHDIATLEQFLDLLLVRKVLILKVDVIPDVVRSQLVVSLFVLDPGVVHEGILEKLLEFAGVFHNLGF